MLMTELDLIIKFEVLSIVLKSRLNDPKTMKMRSKFGTIRIRRPPKIDFDCTLIMILLQKG